MKQLAQVADSAENGRVIQIIGFADYLGTEGFNKGLSNKRAEEVRKYVQSLNGTFKIYSLGKGQILSEQLHTKTGDPANRRVDIVFKKRNLAAVSQGISKSLTVPVYYVNEVRFRAKIDSLSITKVGKSIDFDELIFDPGSHHLAPEAIPLLKELTKYLAKHKNINFEIRGHICCDYQHSDGLDFDTKTLDLSVNRAKEIYEYFLANGISSKRMVYKGVGSAQPKIYPERSDKDEWANRRVEIIIINR